MIFKSFYFSIWKVHIRVIQVTFIRFNINSLYILTGKRPCNRDGGLIPQILRPRKSWAVGRWKGLELGDLRHARFLATPSIVVPIVVVSLRFHWLRILHSRGCSSIDPRPVTPLLSRFCAFWLWHGTHFDSLVKVVLIRRGVQFVCVTGSITATSGFRRRRSQIFPFVNSWFR